MLLVLERSHLINVGQYHLKMQELPTYQIKICVCGAVTEVRVAYVGRLHIIWLSADNDLSRFELRRTKYVNVVV